MSSSGGTCVFLDSKVCDEMSKNMHFWLKDWGKCSENLLLENASEEQQFTPFISCQRQIIRLESNCAKNYFICWKIHLNNYL